MALGLLASGSALYGFVIAYYAFARGLLNEIQWQIEYRARQWDVVAGPDPVKALQDNFRFRRLLHAFLLVATVFFTFSMVSNVIFLATGGPLWGFSGVLLFAVLAGATGAWFVYVALSGLSRGQSELRDLDDFLADALGTDYPPLPPQREDGGGRGRGL